MANHVSIYICDFAEFKRYMDLAKIPLEDVHHQGDDRYFPAFEDAIEFAEMDLDEHEKAFLGWIVAVLTGADDSYIQLEDEEYGSVTVAMFPNMVANIALKAEQVDLEQLADKIHPAIAQDFSDAAALVSHLESYRELLRRAKSERASICGMVWV